MSPPTISSGRRRRAAAVAAATAGSLAALAPAAHAATQTVSAAEAVARSCHERYAPDAAGVDATRVTAAEAGLVHARLSGAGDWDVAVFDANTRRSVAGSAGFHSSELAEGFVRKGQKLVVQACRYGGDAARAQLEVSFAALARDQRDGATQLVEVETPSRGDKARLQKLGLDLTEHGTAKTLETVLHGAEDARRLRAAGFKYSVRIGDLAARARANQRADLAYAAQEERSGLPSGRTTYRRLADYELELKELAARYPALVRPITLNHKTIEGREISGIEITRDPNEVNDGKPIFLNMGVHHAREWPSSEHAIEFAYDLLTNYGSSARTTRLVRDTRTIVVPIVNSDGFNISRESPRAPGALYGAANYEMKRKNCAISATTPEAFRGGTCAENPAGRLRGTDPNRNYGGLWGGPGASTVWRGDTFRGDGPFSEPEVQNIRELQATRNITNLITNHTYSNLVLRPPGVADQGFPLDEPTYKALGDRLASHNDYTSQPSFQLYDTTGGTEDWTFWTAGSLGFTFEIGPEEFHPPYETGVVAEYLGLAPAAGADKGGNREAYYEMLQATADTSLHSLIRGRAPRGAQLTLAKSFQTATSPVWANDLGTSIGDPILFDDPLEYRYDADGRAFRWHVNPSTRPVVAGRSGRDAVAPPQSPIALANPAGDVPENTFDDYTDGPFEAVPFTVAGQPEVDNGKVTIHIEWRNPDTDWDLYVVDSEGNRVAQSAVSGDNTEDAARFDLPPGEYVAHVVNYDQVDGGPFDDWTGEVRFESPRPTTIGSKESWTLTCVMRTGREGTPIQVEIDRGERRNVGDACRTRGK